jgi:hypothetical protein
MKKPGIRALATFIGQPGKMELSVILSLKARPLNSFLVNLYLLTLSVYSFGLPAGLELIARKAVQSF